MDKHRRMKYDVHIGERQTFASYMGYYQRAFDELMDKVENSSRGVGYLAYPLLFLARHTMELGFKTNIRYFLKYSGKDDYAKSDTHNLENLFLAFKVHIDATIKNLNENYGPVDKADVKSFNEYYNEVRKLTNMLHSLDKGSDSFRYPVDTKNNPSFGNKDEIINLLDVKDLFDKCMVMFTHTADVFAKYTDYIDYINDIYESQMREYYSEGYRY